MTAEEIKALPEPDGWGPWSNEAVLLAALCDRIGWLIYATYAAQGGKPAEPEPMRRPGVGRSAADTANLRRTQRISAAHLAYVLEHNGASPPPGWDHGVSDD
jgi:hypothetical protein